MAGQALRSEPPDRGGQEGNWLNKPRNTGNIMTVDMSQFFEVFFDEAEELLAEMERLLLGVDVADPAADDINAIFRAAHSIKGGAATFGLADLTEVTHILESLLDRIRKGEMQLTPEHV